MQNISSSKKDLISSELNPKSKVLLFEPDLSESEKQDLKIEIPISQINQDYFTNKLKNIKKKKEKLQKKQNIINIESSHHQKNIQINKKDKKNGLLLIQEKLDDNNINC